MDKTHHSVSEEWLLKSLVKREDNDFIDQQSRETSINSPQWKQTDFLKYLLLTGNEIDLKKVLCLHLFAITVPPKPCKRGDQTPMKIFEFTNYTFFLPNYYLYKSNQEQLYCPCWEEENNLKNGKLRSYTTHLAVNVSIVNVISSVLKVLTTIDNNLLKKLVSMSHSLRFIKKLLRNDHYKGFIRMLQFSGLFHERNKLRTEESTIIRATSRLISEVAHIKKNMVFTIFVPSISSEKMYEVRANFIEKKKYDTNDKENTMTPQQSNYCNLQKSTNPLLRNLNLKYLPIYDEKGNVDYKKMNSCVNYIVNCKLSGDNNKIVEFTTYSFALPNFFLHDSNEEEFYCRCWYKENKEKIGKLRPCKIHLAVNVAVVEIIETVIEVLSNSNKFGIQKLITLSHDLSAIKACLSDKQYIDYIAGLRNYGIFNNIQKLRTEACTIIKATPKLIEISHIRKNMVLSFRVPDLIQSPNDWFSISATNTTVFDSLEPETKKKHSINTENKEEENKKEVAIITDNINLYKSCHKLSRIGPYNSPITIKRWPFTEKEMNIKKELHQIKRINDKYLRKYNINSKQGIETQNENILHGSSSFDQKVHMNEETEQLKSLDTIKMDSKSKNFTLSKSSVEKKYKIAFQNIRAHSSEKVLLKNKSAQSREKHWVKHFSKQSLKEFNKINPSDTVSSDINKLIIQPIDKADLKNGLLKVELRSKLQKLISSIDDTFIKN